MIRFRNRKSSLLLNLALLAFLVRGLIPVGFMPGHSANNLYPLVICSGAGQATIQVTADKLPYNPQPQQQHSHDTMPCPFALAFAQGVFNGHDEPVYMPVASEPAYAPPPAYLSSNIIIKNYFSHGPPTFPV